MTKKKTTRKKKAKAPKKKAPEKKSKERGQSKEEIIRDRIAKYGYRGVDKTTLAKELKVSRAMLYKYIDKIYKNTPKPEVNKISFDLGNMFEEVLAKNRAVIQKGETKEMQESSRILSQVSKDFTQFLEAFNHKQKVAEPVSHELSWKSFNQAYKNFKEQENASR